MSNTLSQNLFVEFAPDEVIVRSVSVFGDVNMSADAYYVRSSLVDGAPLATFALVNGAGATQQIVNVVPNTRFVFKNKAPVNSQYDFQFVTSADGYPVGFDVTVAIILEFVKYVR